MQDAHYAAYAEPAEEPPRQPLRPAPAGARPFVDVDASGAVDPNAYPEPKESTHKVRGRSDVLHMLFDTANQDLVISKAFYFCFYSAFGSLFPLMAVYFKQMGMNAGQCGILIGVRPIVEFLSTPFWAGLAERYRKGKTMLIAALGCWIFFTMMLSFCQPNAAACVVYNQTHNHYSLEDKRVYKRSVASAWDGPEPAGSDEVPFALHLVDDTGAADRDSLSRRRREITVDHIAGQSPREMTFVANYDKSKHETLRAPPFSSIAYNVKDIQKVFFLTFLLVTLGEFFSAPAITLADSVVLTYLGDDTDHYGRQRMFGSIGWGLAMFFVGIALDHSTSFTRHPCTPHAGERNYTICFATFSVLMGCALIIATQFKFDYSQEEQPEKEPTAEEKYEASLPPVKDWQKPQPEPQQSQRDAIREAMKSLPQLKSRVFANTMMKTPEWTIVFNKLKNVRCMAFLFISWWMGIGMGLIFAFLFWHLQDFGGTPTVFGIASIINHISEIFAYFFCFRLINQYGHVKILCLGLTANVLRFLYISWLTNPWWVLPFELIQGITHASTWAACVSYLNHAVPENRQSAQGVLQVIQHALGKGSGAIFGGIMINYIGSQVTFRIYGFLSLLVLALFVFINYYKKDTGFQTNLDPSEDPRQMADEGGALAPHGVPASPMPRALSSSRLHDQEPGYGSTNYRAQDGTLAPPGGTNPFTAGDMSGTGGGGNGGGYNYAALKTTNPHNPFLPLNNNEEKLRLDAIATEKYADEPADCSFTRRNFKLRDGMVVKAPQPQLIYHAPQPESAAAAAYAW
ncbi:major facilitator superfamily domain-containing protein 6-like isoform X2 [Amphibalanus amphitrite]|uniref:major facilitator superfamily domain-containing protein 6-like isoform X2 n=1 Tax=Amphibalanus amphitrite TaxID=1232801 RepID=UPI001C8FEFB6|nr:major facilitator superfamily domain-containing protein 6-like isoform X2 [Amphibalanus amphitrite]